VVEAHPVIITRLQYNNVNSVWHVLLYMAMCVNACKSEQENLCQWWQWCLHLQSIWSLL